eukprot:11180905-Karenia_brevis.AAC.1
MQEATLNAARTFESVYMWVTSEATGEGGYAVGAMVRELARKSQQSEAELTALKQVMENRWAEMKQEMME